MSLHPSCFSVFKMYIQRLKYQVFPMKTSEASRYGQNVWKINGEDIEYLWVKENLIEPLQKSHRIIFHILCDMGLPCSKLNNSNLIKDRNIISFYSFQKVHKFCFEPEKVTDYRDFLFLTITNTHANTSLQNFI